MKAYKVLKGFYYTNRTPENHYKKDDTFPKEGIELTEENLKLLLDGKFILPEEDVEKMSVKELKAFLLEHGVSHADNLKKDELIEIAKTI